MTAVRFLSFPSSHYLQFLCRHSSSCEVSRIGFVHLFQYIIFTIIDAAVLKGFLNDGKIMGDLRDRKTELYIYITRPCISTVYDIILGRGEVEDQGAGLRD